MRPIPGPPPTKQASDRSHSLLAVQNQEKDRSCLSRQGISPHIRRVGSRPIDRPMGRHLISPSTSKVPANHRNQSRVGGSHLNQP